MIIMIISIALIDIKAKSNTLDLSIHTPLLSNRAPIANRLMV